jgi:hypothetical protein
MLCRHHCFRFPFLLFPLPLLDDAFYLFFTDPFFSLSSFFYYLLRSGLPLLHRSQHVFLWRKGKDRFGLATIYRFPFYLRLCVISFLSLPFIISLSRKKVCLYLLCLFFFFFSMAESLVGFGSDPVLSSNFHL